MSDIKCTISYQELYLTGPLNREHVPEDPLFREFHTSKITTQLLGNGRISGMPDIRSGYLGIRHYPDLPDTSGRPDPDIKNFCIDQWEGIIKAPRPCLNINVLSLSGYHKFPPKISSLLIPNSAKDGQTDRGRV